MTLETGLIQLNLTFIKSLLLQKLVSYNVYDKRNLKLISFTEDNN